MSRLLDVVAVMDRLRSAGGCPWDAKQTHASLMPYLLEEAYEVYEALENGDLDAPARGARRPAAADRLPRPDRRRDLVDIDDVAGDLVDKLVRRHPHVFAGASADDLEGSWEALKAAEKGRVSVTEGIPLGQPALALAAKLQRRAAKLGVPPVSYDGSAASCGRWSRAATSEGLDPEVELRAVARRFRDRLAVARGRGAADRSTTGATGLADP